MVKAFGISPVEELREKSSFDTYYIDLFIMQDCHSDTICYRGQIGGP